ncbi:uncharacterized protein LOC105693332 [Athalia rosae]|uniref:uncharacterized protein LOC105693332 n=1 Tax=Athalia rosae TaxID=37344 RepID=UPI0006263BF6|nr:uncharacterized protein LOC105693332 [Athalia rosae]
MTYEDVIMPVTPQTATFESGKLPSELQRELRCQRAGTEVTCGMLPTLRALASRECWSPGTVCLVSQYEKTDPAQHLQMTLLEAYCREHGIQVVNVRADYLRSALGPQHVDLSCVLVTIADPFVLESPE